ncbi:hypothetical protein [Nocardioides currus]|uniref:Uncharacterized protein n=1 Tax=Nocardioides currus TaxID=2133958 RepID=A0A2R7YXM6_9ACTN|nr:hypothetical protein [Nocardioides currus]PUA81137.1 hypothetical protein C7S10_08815 [Nocardioides currus]
MTRPPSVTAGAILAAMAAGLTALLWTVMDLAPVTRGTTPPPPARPRGVSQEEWDRVLARAADADPGPMTNLDLFAWLVHAGLVALAVAVIVLWLVVAVAAPGGRGWARILALTAAGGAVLAVPIVTVGSAPAVAVVAWTMVAAGLASAVLLVLPASAAYFAPSSEAPTS